MNANLLIDAIVTQTTVLIAQLATAAGLRAPLANTANQVFLDLVRELKEQGLGNKVIADMFGLALSTYHDKIRRLSESRTQRGRSLWEAVLSFIQERNSLLQAEVLARFRHDDQATVRGVLNDLVESGLVFRTGRGDRTSLRAARAEDLALNEDSGFESLANLVWLTVHRAGPIAIAQIGETVPADTSTLTRILERLAADGRVVRTEREGASIYTADDCVIPIGETAGWEAAVFDHYQAMVTAICAKLRRGSRTTTSDETIGGSTYGFTVWPGHPYHDDVMGLLAKLRSDVAALRRRVHEYNQSHPGPEGRGIGVIAYLGQTVMEPVGTEVGP